MFRVGQKVVCVSAGTNGHPMDIRPRVGCVYTIRGIEFDRPAPIHPVGLWLEEIKNPLRSYAGYSEFSETSFSALRFRPVIERKTDISVFTEILRKVSRKQGADA